MRPWPLAAFLALAALWAGLADRVAAAEPVLLPSTDKAAAGDVVTLTYDISKGGCEWTGDIHVTFAFIDPNASTPTVLGDAPLLDCIASISVVVPAPVKAGTVTLEGYIEEPDGFPTLGTEAYAQLFVDLPSPPTGPPTDKPPTPQPPTPQPPTKEPPPVSAPPTLLPVTEPPPTKPDFTATPVITGVVPTVTNPPPTAPAVVVPVPGPDDPLRSPAPLLVGLVTLIGAGLILIVIWQRSRIGVLLGRTPSLLPLGVPVGGFVPGPGSGSSPIPSNHNPTLIVVPRDGIDRVPDSYLPTGTRREPSRDGCDFSRDAWDAVGEAFSWHDGDTIPGRHVRIAGRPLVPLGGDYWHIPYRRGNGQAWWGSALGDDRDALTGTLTSREFVINFKFISFLIAGDRDEERLRVELLVRAPHSQPTTHAVVTGHGDDRFRQVVWNVAALQGQIGSVRLIDDSEEGHIDVAALSCSLDEPAKFIAPIWGWADLHAHPMANWGFGGRLIHGSAGGSLPSLGSCEDIHGAGGTGLGNNTIAVALFGDGELGHRTHGWDQFDGWPKHTSQLHQTMHWEWVRRAFDGGQRLLVALAVNSELLAHEFGGQPTLEHDWNSIVAQVANWGATIPDWAEIAYTPADARRIIAEDRLAIVLGIEVDRALGRLPYGTSRDGIRRRLADLRNLGIRQLNPMHFTDNEFGGPAVYGDMFNLANAYQGHYYQVEGQPPGDERDRIDFRMAEHEDDAVFVARRDRTFLIGATVGGVVVGAVVGVVVGALLGPWGALIGGIIGGAVGGLLGFGLGSLSTGSYRPPDYNAIDPGRGHRNRVGLSSVGRVALAEMRRQGMIIDIDHMSEKASAETLEQMRAYSYPVVSAHASMRELSPRRRWGDEDHAQTNHRDVQIRGLPTPITIDEPYERRSHHFWPHESEKTAETIQKIAALGGMIAPISGGLSDSRSWGEQVLNTCAGSSRTWAQEFLYANHHMGGSRGVGLGSDAVALLQQPGPRFGTQAAWGLRAGGEPDASDASHGARRHQADIQTRGVAYDSPIRDYRAYRFFGRDIYEWQERDIWEATAMVKCNVNPRLGNLPPDHGPGAGNRTDDVQNKINNIAKGFFANSDEELERPFLFGGGTYAEQRAAFLVKTLYPGTPPGVPRVQPPVLPESEEGRVRELFPMIWRVWNMWDRMEHDETGAPSNAPLTRSMAGRRDFDINIDGVAHYGMYADFLQDLKNVGISDDNLAVLFRSAEDYIEIWERCEAFAAGLSFVVPAQLEGIQQVATTASG